MKREKVLYCCVWFTPWPKKKPREHIKSRKHSSTYADVQYIAARTGAWAFMHARKTHTNFKIHLTAPTLLRSTLHLAHTCELLSRGRECLTETRTQLKRKAARRWRNNAGQKQANKRQRLLPETTRSPRHTGRHEGETRREKHVLVTGSHTEAVFVLVLNYFWRRLLSFESVISIRLTHKVNILVGWKTILSACVLIRL